MKIFILELFFYYFFLLYLYWRVGYIYNRNGNLAFLGSKMPNPASIITYPDSSECSLAWTGHLVHVAIPGARGEYVRWNNFLDVLPHPQGLGPLFTGQWNLYAQNPDSSSHLFGTSQGAGTAILTLLGGFHPQTQSLWLTDIAHHHLAIAFIFLVAGHMYRTNFGIGHSMKDLLEAHIPPGGRLGRGHKGLYDTINNSIHFQLGLALASLGVITSLGSPTHVLFTCLCIHSTRLYYSKLHYIRITNTSQGSS
ncbi:hypothetical protein RND81_O276600 [Saponaria officinalis]|uniref:Photosystem I P700 chlorophyll a apoprotein A2 n=1 Tax=Saponaria officinalis TaxID=3572 RepID=A0AAW1GFQ7_SAPOF